MDLTEAFHRFAPMVFSIGLAVLKSREDAEDLVQEVFTNKAPRILQDSENRPRDELGKILATMARNQAIDIYRRRHRFPYHPMPDGITAPDDSPPDPDLEQALGELEFRFQEVLTFKYLLHLSWEEVARRLGLSTQGARKRSEKAKKLLRSRLLENEEDT